MSLPPSYSQNGGGKEVVSFFFLANASTFSHSGRIACTRSATDHSIPKTLFMNPVLYADIAEVKRTYFSAYQFPTCTDPQLDKLVKNHYTSSETLLRKVHVLPCQVELIVRLAVHFKCKYHEVLGFMVQEYRNCRSTAMRYTAEYYHDKRTHCNAQPVINH